MRITGGFLNSRKIKSAKSQNVRPTLSKTRQGIFNSLNSIMEFDGRSFLDLFAGSAIMSFEAISRGFEDVCTVERDKKTAKIIRENFDDFALKPDLIITDAIKFLKSTDKKFDVIFIDPPYQSDLYEKSLMQIYENKLLNPDGIVILEHPSAKNIDISHFELIKNKDYSDIRVSFLVYS